MTLLLITQHTDAHLSADGYTTLCNTAINVNAPIAFHRIDDLSQLKCDGCRAAYMTLLEAQIRDMLTPHVDESDITKIWDGLVAQLNREVFA